MPGLFSPARCLTYDKRRRRSLGILCVPKIVLVLDALGAGAVLEHRQRQQHVLQASLLEATVALALSMVARVFPPQDLLAQT